MVSFNNLAQLAECPIFSLKNRSTLVDRPTHAQHIPNDHYSCTRPIVRQRAENEINRSELWPAGPRQSTYSHLFFLSLLCPSFVFSGFLFRLQKKILHNLFLFSFLFHHLLISSLAFPFFFLLSLFLSLLFLSILLPFLFVSLP